MLHVLRHVKRGVSLLPKLPGAAPTPSGISLFARNLTKKVQNKALGKGLIREHNPKKRAVGGQLSSETNPANSSASKEDVRRLVDSTKLNTWTEKEIALWLRVDCSFIPAKRRREIVTKFQSGKQFYAWVTSGGLNSLLPNDASIVKMKLDDIVAYQEVHAKMKKVLPLHDLKNDVLVSTAGYNRDSLLVPYGVIDFATLRSTEGAFYVDKTRYIKMFEDSGAPAFVYLRPRRFGKSFFLSTLSYFYDLRYELYFNKLFGGLAIGNHADLMNRNKHIVLKLDFSQTKPQSGNDALKDYTKLLNQQIETACHTYGLDPAQVIDKHRCDFSLVEFIAVARRAFNNQAQVVILVDEYDNMFNEAIESKSRYKSLAGTLEAVKNLFAAMKAAVGRGEVLRIFITGINPIVLADVSSGMNIATHISSKEQFEDLCGFTDKHVETILEELVGGKDNPDFQIHFKRLILHYNGYRFVDDSKTKLFNSTQTLHYFQNLNNKRPVFDENVKNTPMLVKYVKAHENVLNHILGLLHGESIPASIIESFDSEALYRSTTQAQAFLSLLYFSGAIAKGEEPNTVRITNLAQRRDFFATVQKILEGEEATISSLQLDGVSNLTKTGDPTKWVKYLERCLQIKGERQLQTLREISLQTSVEMTMINAIQNTHVAFFDKALAVRENTPSSWSDFVFPDILLLARDPTQHHDIMMELKFVDALKDEKIRDLKPHHLKEIMERYRTSTKLEENSKVKEGLDDASKQLRLYMDVWETAREKLAASLGLSPMPTDKSLCKGLCAFAVVGIANRVVCQVVKK